MNLKKIFHVVGLLLATLMPSLLPAQQLMPILKPGTGYLKSTETTLRGPSSNLWEFWRGRTRGANDFTEDGIQFFDDFCNFGVGSGTVYRGYGIHLDTGNTIQEIATEIGGVVHFTTDGTDNDSCELISGGNVGTLVKIPSSAGDVVIYESRWRVNQVTNTYNMFVGLTEEGTAVDDGMFTDAGAGADKDKIGFQVLEADGDALEFTYKKAGQTAVVTTGLKAIAANVWYRTGFVYDPRLPAASRLRIYIDNADTGTKYTSTNIAAATFPSGEELAVAMGIKNGGAAASSFDVDWAGVAEAQ